MKKNVSSLLVGILLLTNLGLSMAVDEAPELKTKNGSLMVSHGVAKVGRAVSDSTNVAVSNAATADHEQEAMMARMKEYTTPNENHQVLANLVGHWKTNCQFWMDSKGQPQVSEGTSEAKMIMGGRFLEQNFTGTAMGQPFEGRGIYGYDNLRKEYTGIWFDNMATGIMVSAGKYNATTKTLLDEGSMFCPITQENHRWYRSATTLIDDNHYSYETFMKDKDGQEFRSMLIAYTRV